MSRRSTKYSVIAFILSILMLVWVFAVVLLTGGRKISDFSAFDYCIIGAFAAAELATSAGLIIALAKLSHSGENSQVQEHKSKYGKFVKIRYYVLIAVSFAAAFILSLLGIVAGHSSSDSMYKYAWIVLAVSFALSLSILTVNIFLRRKFLQTLKYKNADELQKYILSHRNAAKDTSEKKLVFITRIRRMADCTAVVLFLISACISFCAGFLYSETSVPYFPLFLLSAYLIFTSISRIRTSPPKMIFTDNEACISENDCPLLYGLAYRAAHTMKCKGTVKIVLSDDCNAGIGRFGSIYSVQIGIILLCTLTDDEMYNILLHEFAHIKFSTSASKKDDKYNSWLCSSGNPHLINSTPQLFFCYLDTLYEFHYNMYLYASSILSEEAADNAMLEYGSAKAAASALIKVKYYYIYTWEAETTDERPPFESEKPDKMLFTAKIEDFRNAIYENMDKWNHLIDVEILSRSASHPTLKMRLASLGISGTGNVYFDNTNREYANECSRILSYFEDIVYKERCETYDNDRKENYIEPKELVDSWISGGRPVVAEDYADISIALRQLGRVSEAVELIDRAIESLPPAAASYAYFVKGVYMLHRYDSAGLDYIYLAIKHNPSYIDSGLANIGEFCCMTGRQDDLDVYREKSIALMQDVKDKYIPADILTKKDVLTVESLPGGTLDRILNYIKSADDSNYLFKIYLVRKIISNDYFSSVFILQFSQKAFQEYRLKVMRKIFNYLDTLTLDDGSEWQFSLFDYDDVAYVKSKITSIENSCVYSHAAA